MIRKPFLWYLQYLFWAQLAGSLLSLVLLFMSAGTAIPVISRAEMPAAPTEIPQLTATRLTGTILIADASWYEHLLLTQISWTPLRDAAMALASLAFSVVMLLFFRSLKKGQRFSSMLVRHLRQAAWVLIAYIAADFLLTFWRWKVVEQVSQNKYLPLYKLEHLRPVLLVSLLLLVVSLLLQKATQIDEENALTI